MPSYPSDVAGPGLILVLGLGLVGGVLLLALVVVVEGVILRLLRWGTFWRSVLAALVMNFVSGLAGLVLLSLQVLVGNVAWLLLAFLASVAIEGGVLALMNRGQARLNWLAALVANVVTYIPLGLLYLLVGLEGV